MKISVRVVFAVVSAVALLSGVAFGQVVANESTVQISGHIVNPIGVPISNYTVKLGIPNTPNTNQATTVTINHDGSFTIPAVSRIEQVLYVNELPTVGITIAVVEDIDLGNIVANPSSSPVRSFQRF
jgi:hypothetical protein